MTRDEILAMEPGREMDILVARKVLRKEVVFVRALGGYKWNEDNPEQEYEPVFDDVPCIQEHGTWAYAAYSPDKEYVLDVVPLYSLEMEAAWEVVWHLADTVEVSLSRRPGGRWECSFGEVSAEAPALPEAVCKAALLLVAMKE